MIVDGKHVPNISCSKCGFRHPQNLTCEQARMHAYRQRGSLFASEYEQLGPRHQVFELGHSVKRGLVAVQCACGGYAAATAVTAEEEAKFGCGRPNCCAVAFVCVLCSARHVGKCEAPEMD